MPYDSVRILLSNKEIAVLIGIKGESIRALRSMCKARIHIDQSKLLNRVVTITGDISDIVHTLVQISTTICTEGSKKPCLQLLQHDDVCRALVSKSGQQVSGNHH